MSPTARPEGFEGDLKALSVVEIVQTLTFGGKTARLLVRSNARRGEIWFQDGAMTHAAAGTMFGDLAVYAMVEWTSGHFVVEYGLSTELRSITQDGTFLVLEGLRRLDERSQSAPVRDASAEIQPVLETDVRRAHARRRALGLLVVGVTAAAIVAACFADWRSPSAIDAAAAMAPVTTPEPVVARESLPPPRSTQRPATSLAIAKPQRPMVTQAPLVAPESPTAEDPLPSTTLFESRTPIDRPAAPIGDLDEPPRLLISGKSGADGGSLTVVIDGEPAYTQALLGKRQPFQAAIVLTPGEHLIVARLENGATAGVHEALTRSVFANGERRSLRITVNRTFGSPVKVKLDP